jgi:hypothetical protein
MIMDWSNSKFGGNDGALPSSNCTKRLFSGEITVLSLSGLSLIFKFRIAEWIDGNANKIGMRYFEDAS